MEVSDKEIRAFQVYLESLQVGLHGLHAFWAIHPRIDHEESSVPFDHIGIDSLKGVGRKGDLLAE
jgi:hypothetical protein